MSQYSAQIKYRHNKNKERGGVICPICNFCCVSLGGHMYYSHNITAREWRIKNDMFMKERLVTEQLHEILVKRKRCKFTKEQLEKLNKGRRNCKGVTRYMSKKELKKKILQSKINLVPYQYLGRTSEQAKKRLKNIKRENT